MWLPFYREGKWGSERSSVLCAVTGMEINGAWIWTSDPCSLPVFHRAVLGRGSPHLSDPKLPFLDIFSFIIFAAAGLSCSMGIRCCSAGGFSLVKHVGSMARGLSCTTAWGILVPWPGIEPASPALEGGFLTTGSPGKSPWYFLLLLVCPGNEIYG